VGSVTPVVARVIPCSRHRRRILCQASAPENASTQWTPAQMRQTNRPPIVMTS
jgi:hypothetical protein